MQTDTYLHIEDAATTLRQTHLTTVGTFVSAWSSRQLRQALEYRAAVHACRRVFRLHRTLRALRCAAHEAIRRRIVESQRVERANVEHEELVRRREELHGAEQKQWVAVMRPFLQELVPLIADVLRNIQRVEERQRQSISESEAAFRRSVQAANAAEQADAIKRAQQREQAFLAARAILFDELLQAKRVTVRDAEALEAEARDRIHRAWVPAQQRMQRIWRRAEILRTARDATLRRLEAERERELQRLRQRQQEKVQREGRQWVERTGHDGARRDARYWASAGLSPEGAERCMRGFLEQRGPSRVLSPEAHRRHRDPGTPNLDGVRSVADYASRWRRAFNESSIDEPGQTASARPLRNASQDFFAGPLSRHRDF